MNKCIERIVNGIVKENPTFVMLIGMCPTLAVTTSAINGIGMGLSTTLVLVFSNLLISLLRKIIPDSARVPAFIVVVASLVTIVQFLLQGLCTIPVCITGYLYPSDRSKLYHPWSCRELCFKEPGSSVYL